MDLGLEGKRAFVLAASKGLGRAVVAELAREGASVVITSRDAERLETAAEEIREETGRAEDAVDLVVCDLGDGDAVREATNAAVDRLGADSTC